MFYLTDDLRIERLKPLIPPAILMEQHPISEVASATVAEGRLIGINPFGQPGVEAYKRNMVKQLRAE